MKQRCRFCIFTCFTCDRFQTAPRVRTSNTLQSVVYAAPSSGVRRHQVLPAVATTAHRPDRPTANRVVGVQQFQRTNASTSHTAHMPNCCCRPRRRR